MPYNLNTENSEIKIEQKNILRQIGSSQQILLHPKIPYQLKLFRYNLQVLK